MNLNKTVYQETRYTCSILYTLQNKYNNYLILQTILIPKTGACCMFHKFWQKLIDQNYKVIRLGL